MKISTLENDLNLQIARAKSDYEANLINTYAPKNVTKIYQYISSITGQNNIPITVTSSATTDQNKASLFNLYFHSVFTQSTFILPSANKLPTLKHCCEDVVISEGDVYQNIDPSKAMGCDQIGPKLLKHCALALYKPLHHLLCLSVKQGYVRNGWRTHLITPVHKSGDRSCVTNYRPISLLYTVSKTLEGLVYNHLLPFVADSLSSVQFGF